MDNTTEITFLLVKLNYPLIVFEVRLWNQQSGAARSDGRLLFVGWQPSPGTDSTVAAAKEPP